MYDGIVAAIDCHMAAVADDISRLRFCQAYFISYASHRAGGMRQAYTEIRVHAHDKTGTIRAVRQACTSVYIRVPYELACKACNRVSAAAAGAASYYRLRRAAGRTLCLGFHFSRFSSSLFFCRFFLCQARFLFFFGLSLYKVSSQIYIVSGYPAVSFFDGDLNPAVLLTGNSQLFAFTN